MNTLENIRKKESLILNGSQIDIRCKSFESEWKISIENEEEKIQCNTVSVLFPVFDSFVDVFRTNQFFPYVDDTMPNQYRQNKRQSNMDLTSK